MIEWQWVGMNIAIKVGIIWRRSGHLISSKSSFQGENVRGMSGEGTGGNGCLQEGFHR